MERDARRDRGQWRGCYSFKGIICDGDDGSIPRRNGGLKMGQTYYYYYELDGTAETHDPSLPSTNTCPYLPGQTVNTLWVPVEQSIRSRSASMNSLRDENYQTMNPADKFIKPRPVPSVPVEPPLVQRVDTAPARLNHKRSARSLSPGSWAFSPRKLFTRKASSSSLKDRAQSPPLEDDRSIKSTEGSRSRDISPESLRRFLSDTPTEEEHRTNDHRPAIIIPEDIVEENEDDDNFATSALSENLPFTGLSPPPTQRSTTPSPPSTIVSLSNPLPKASVVEPQTEKTVPAAPTRPPPPVPHALSVTVPGPQSYFSFSDYGIFSHNSPKSPGSNSLPSFYHSEDDEEEDVSAYDGDVRKPQTLAKRNFDATLSTYSLPRSSLQDDAAVKLGSSVVNVASASPTIVARGDGTDDVVPFQVGNTSSLLTSHIPNSGLDNLLSELGWMANVIRG
ncbi:hypothetical protein B0T17DRAFT_495008 [Bombardia bombarda]|uniref:Uncharacterized protein n=1 Tax=Bombardia bombarda TaxID=252184 RepID=A0AA39WTQ5_9PEZI|nr:hypothetical protein B0T17DRAFT_495008 [Bombardia bombarda]